MAEQLADFGFTNPDCARRVHNAAGQPVADIVQCTGGVSDIDPNGSPTGATQLLTDFSDGNSSSHQFQLTVDRRFSKHFGFRAAYTVSKTIDLTSGFRARSAQFTDPLNPAFDRGLADFDAPQRLVFSGIWELPLDRPFREHAIAKKITEGWQLNAIVAFQSGQPLTLYSNSNSSNQNNFLDRPDLVGPIVYQNPRNLQAFNSDCAGGSSTGLFWFDPTSFDCSNVPIFTFGTLPRNIIRGPGINNWTISFLKRTALTEHKSLEFRAELFNAFNHTQYLNPDNQGGDGTFGQLTSDRGPRLIQFGLKFYY
jgi:hypothetical protein